MSEGYEDIVEFFVSTSKSNFTKVGEVYDDEGVYHFPVNQNVLYIKVVGECSGDDDLLELEELTINGKTNESSMTNKVWRGSLNSQEEIYRTGKVGIGRDFGSGIIPLSQLSILSDYKDNAGIGIYTGKNNLRAALTTTNMGGGQIKLYSRYNDLNILLSSDDDCYFNNLGNVGIGTTTPEQSLHIYRANARCYLNLDKASSGYETGLEFANNGKVQFFFFTDNGSDDLKLQATGLNGENDGAPRIWTPKSNKNLFLGLSGGNLGIGTTNPTAKLEVNGMIKVEHIKVVNDVPASDYVFEPGYKLRPLEEVEEYVIVNKHLPEVPSVAEFKENGYSIGEMDDVLLRKIEELTLYMIELQKEIEKLKRQNEELLEVVNKN